MNANAIRLRSGTSRLLRRSLSLSQQLVQFRIQRGGLLLQLCRLGVLFRCLDLIAPGAAL